MADSVRLGDKDYALVQYDEDVCKGPGDPDYYGYPGESEEEIDGDTYIDPKPF